MSAERETQIRQKIMAMGKVARMYKTLRQENENVLKLKGMCMSNPLMTMHLQNQQLSFHKNFQNTTKTLCSVILGIDFRGKRN